MINEADKRHTGGPSPFGAQESIATPSKVAKSGDLTPRTIEAPRMESRLPAPTTEHVRDRTSLAKRLEISMINQSIRNSPLRLDLPPQYQEATGTAISTSSVTTVSGASTATESPRRPPKLEREYPTLANRMISSPRGKIASTPARPPLVNMPAVKASTTQASEPSAPPGSPRKQMKAHHEFKSDFKDKVGQLISPQARTRHLFENLDWTILTNSYQPDPGGGRFRMPVVESHSTSQNPVAGGKRKANDDPEPRINKRLRFADEEYSRGSENPPPDEREKDGVQFGQTKIIDKLSKASGDRETTPGEKDAAPVTSANDVGLDDLTAYPFKPAGLGKAILRAREKNETWFALPGSMPAAEGLQLALKRIRESNPGTINGEACDCLQELFSLLPAGALAGTEVFRKGLNRSIREVSFTTSQWNHIEALHRDYDQLDVGSHPERAKLFKGILNYVIKAKNLLAERNAES